jgi:hypothetical protein
MVISAAGAGWSSAFQLVSDIFFNESVSTQAAVSSIASDAVGHGEDPSQVALVFQELKVRLASAAISQKKLTHHRFPFPWVLPQLSG